MIYFDGMYSFISLGLSMISIYIIKFISKCDTKKFPFGNYIVEPLGVAFKLLVIFVLCMYSIVEAVQKIINGGNEMQLTSAMIYSIVSTLGCSYVFLYMKRSERYSGSQLVKTDAEQWLMDTILSAAVLIGFSVAIFLHNTQYSNVNNYIDSGMVIIASSIFVIHPIRTFIQSFREIVAVKADDSIVKGICEIVHKVEEDYCFADSIVRVSKTGRLLRIEIDFIYDNETLLHSLDDMDNVREVISQKIDIYSKNNWLNISFTGNRKWAE